MVRRRRVASSTNESGRSRKTSASSSRRRRAKGEESAAMRGEEESGNKRKRVLAKGVISSSEAKEMVKKMRETSGSDYYDVSRLENPDRMIVFDIPDDPTVVTGEDGNDYTNLVPKKIVELEGDDVVEVYHDVSLKAPTMVINAIWGTKDKDPQIEDDDCFMSYANWEDYKKYDRKYHKVLWAVEGEGGLYEKVYNSVD